MNGNIPNDDAEREENIGEYRRDRNELQNAMNAVIGGVESGESDESCEKDENDIRELLGDLIEEVDFLHEDDLQMGGQTVIIKPIDTPPIPKAFRKDISQQLYEVRFSRRLTAEPDSELLYAKELIKMAKELAPPNITSFTKVGIVMESDQFKEGEDIGFPLQPMRKLKPEDFVKNMERMGQSERSPLSVKDPVFKVRLSYVTEPFGSGKKREVCVRDLLSLDAFGKPSEKGQTCREPPRKRRKNNGLILDDISDGEEDEDDEGEDDDENGDDEDLIDNRDFPDFNYNAFDNMQNGDDSGIQSVSPHDDSDSNSVDQPTTRKRRIVVSDDEDGEDEDEPASMRRRIVASDDDDEDGEDDDEPASMRRRKVASDDDEDDEEDDEPSTVRKPPKTSPDNIMLNDVEKDCLPFALQQSMRYLQYRNGEKTRYQFRAVLRKNKEKDDLLQQEITKMKEAANVTKNRDFTPADVEKFQYGPFHQKYQIVLYSENSDSPIFAGPFISEKKQMIIYLRENHYQGVKSLGMLMNSHYVCPFCFKRGGSASSHYRCKGKHQICGKFIGECENTDPNFFGISCRSCRFMFLSMKCYENHLDPGRRGGKSMCQRRTFCQGCDSIVYNNKGNRHQCGKKFCRVCQKTVVKEHSCQMPKSVRNEEAIKKLRLYFDVESVAGKDGIQIPVLFISMKTCPLCFEKVGKSIAEAESEECECSPDGRLKIIECITEENKNVDVAKEMFDYIFQKAHKGYVACAHNMSGYDGQFLVHEIIRRNIGEPKKLVTQGSKITLLELNNVRVIDSMKYIAISLNKLGKTFQIEVPKGDFPIGFIKKENFGYVGDFPDLEFYNLDDKTEEEGERIRKFVEENQNQNEIFDFNVELLNYCFADVKILTEAMGKYESEFEKFTNVTILEESCTAASATVKVFRRNHLDETKPIYLDPCSTQKGNYSVVSQKMLAYREMIDGKQIKRQTTTGEETVAGFKVDGYIEPCAEYPKGKVIEFNGCLWHAHECKYSPTRTIFRNEIVSTAADIRDRDEKRNEKIREVVSELEIIWECHVRAELKTNKEMAKFFSSYKVPETIDISESLTGGRTEVFRLHSKAEKGKELRYSDVMSLYPYVMKHSEYPAGEPFLVYPDQIPVPITQKDQISFDGFMCVKVLPPRKLALPLLPAKIDGKLFFALCTTCVIKRKNLNGDCAHNDQERTITGTFTTKELEKAVELGYVITSVHMGVGYPEMSVLRQYSDGSIFSYGVFGSFVDSMLKAKIYASGWPEGIETGEQKRKFVADYKQKEGIELDVNLFEKNEGKRLAAKLTVNSLWGKLAQSLNMTCTSIFTKPDSFWKLYRSISTVVQSFQVFGEALIVKHKKRDECVEILPTSAMHLASYTTSHARLKLYSFMEKVGGERLLYTDTDSLIYEVVDGRDPLEEDIGQFLGQLTNELQGEMLEFVSLGPKTYAYKEKMPDGQIRCVRKSKGIKCSKSADEKMGFRKMKRMVEEVLANEERSEINVDQFNMRRNQFFKVFATRQKKKFRYTFEKRKVVQDGSTKPFGY